MIDVFVFTIIHFMPFFLHAFDIRSAVVFSLGSFESAIVTINSSYKKPTRKDLQTILLQTKALEGQSVNITDKKEMYEFEADKLVY